MSGPIGSSEIEDVVSSMRRLMAMEPRPRPVSRDLGQDRLVLTPALRVVPDPATEAPPIVAAAMQAAEAEPEPEPEPELAAEPAAEMVADQVVDHVDDALMPEPAEAAPPKPEMREAFEAEWEDEIWAAPEPPLAELALGIEEAEILPDLPPAETPSLAAAEDSGKPVLQALEVEAPWAEVGDDWLDDLDASADAFAAGGQSRAGKRSAEPGAGLKSGSGAGDSADGPATAKADGAAAAGSAAGTTAPRGAQGEPRLGVLELSAADLLTDGDGNPLTVLDEAALQLIIRQLIREELKGVLGEKITQSVRKLVRAEINRALAAHALD